MRFEDFTAYLAACGVKRFTIEIDDSRITDCAVPATRSETLALFNGHLGYPLVGKDVPPAKMTPPPSMRQEIRAKPEEPAKTPEAVKPAAESKPAAEEKAEPKPEPEKKEVKAEPPAKKQEKPAEKPSAKPVEKKAESAYEEFLSIVEKDDGSGLRDLLEPVVARLTLDEMLRLNAEFGLGLDTDRKTEDIRADVLECW